MFLAVSSGNSGFSMRVSLILLLVILTFTLEYNVRNWRIFRLLRLTFVRLL